MSAHQHDWPDWTDDDDEWLDVLRGDDPLDGALRGALGGDLLDAGCSCHGPLDESGPDDDLLPTHGTVLREPADVLDFLLPLIGPERAGPMALWCALVDADDRSLPLVMPIGGVPLRPDPQMLGNLARLLADLLAEHAPDGGIAFAVVRRTGGDRGEVEQAWARELGAACATADVRVRAICAVGRDRARVLRW